MKINVLKIPEEGLTLQFSKEGDWFCGLHSDRTECDFALETVNCSCTVRLVQKNVIVEGSVAAVVDHACSRCLEITRLPVKNAFRSTFMPADERILDDQELSAEDIEFSYYQGEVIDLDQILFEQILLQIPMKVLCIENCKGLCPRCGTNLNISSCDCSVDQIDDRLAVLKNFKVKSIRVEKR